MTIALQRMLGSSFLSLSIKFSFLILGLVDAVEDGTRFLSAGTMERRAKFVLLVWEEPWFKGGTGGGETAGRRENCKSPTGVDIDRLTDLRLASAAALALVTARLRDVCCG